jgi:hypothetical protein
LFEDQLGQTGGYAFFIECRRSPCAFMERAIIGAVLDESFARKHDGEDAEPMVAIGIGGK